MKWICKIFGHKWPFAIKTLIMMAVVEVRNGVTEPDIIRCHRCSAERDLNKEVREALKEKENKK